MRYQVEPYRTPEGYTDFPFTYVFDATGLTDGTTIPNLSKPLQGDSDFVMRHVLGLETVVDTPANGGKVQLYNGSGSQVFGSQAGNGIYAPQSVAVVPEKIYHYNEQIKFDLTKILRAANAGAVLTSYIGFRGVKRFHGNPGYGTGKTPYAWREVPQVYSYSLTVNWDYVAGGNPHRFTQGLDNYDFELFRVLISNVTAGAGGGPGAGITTNDFGVTLYDSQGHQLSDLPLPAMMLSSSKPTPQTQQKYQSVVPVPSLVYPAASQIVFDVTSWLPGALASPQTYNVAFQGVWRVPCVNPRT